MAKKLKTSFCLKLGTRVNCLVTALKQIVKQEKNNKCIKVGKKETKCQFS